MKGKRNALKTVAIVSASLAVLTAVLVAVLALYIRFNIDFSADEALFDVAGKWSSTVFYAPEDTDGEEYIPVEIELGGSLKKLHYSLDEIADCMRLGIVAVEDRNFEAHHGVDVRRTLAAAFNYIFSRGKLFGASTITQQVVKNISGDNDISAKRKFNEMLRAVNIETEYTKDEILEVYLNIIPMSENMYGVGIASRTYFGKEPSELTPAEAAMLIGITNAPTAYNPYNHPDACIKKRNSVLAVMHREGVIDREEYDAAVASELGVLPRENAAESRDSWFIETVIEDISAELAEKYEVSRSAARMRLLGGGYRVYTTEDTRVQRILEEYFEDISNLPAEIGSGLQLAVAVIGKDGDLRGVIGRAGPKEGNRLLNHATALHTPASALKPLALYAPLLDSGRITPATVFDDVPVSFSRTADGYREFPRNSPDVYSGLITVKDAVRLSKNTVAVRLCNMLGEREVFQSLRDSFGFSSLVEKRATDSGSVTDLAVAPMALGQLTDGLPLVRLTAAYTVFQNDGCLSEYHSYISLNDSEGNTVLSHTAAPRRIFSTATARAMTQLLQGVVASGTASQITLKNVVDTAGKTGTSGGNRDKLFVGYTPYLTAGIWCGYENGASFGVLSPSHLEMWDAVMNRIHEGYSGERRFSTEGLVKREFCMDSGRAVADACLYDPRGSRTDTAYFNPAFLPTGSCNRHVLVYYDTVEKAVACPNCPRDGLARVALVSIPERSFPKEIYVSDAELVYRDLPGRAPMCDDPCLPYFYYTLRDGEFVGISRSKKQFNKGCHAHRR